jgi:MFS family permease
MGVITKKEAGGRSSGRLRIFRGWYTVFMSGLTGCSLSACFPQFSMTVFPLSGVSGLPVDLLLIGESVKSCAIVLGMFLYGFVYQKLGFRLTFITALLAIVIPQCILPSVSSAPVFFALKCIQGLGSLAFPLFLVLIMNWMPREQTGLSTAIFNGMFYGGGGIGGTFAGFIIVTAGWRASYYVLAALIVFLGLVWLLTVKEGAEPQSAAGRPPRKASGGAVFWKDYRVWFLALAFFGTTWAVQAITVDMPLYGAFLGYDEIGIGSVLAGVTAAMVISCVVSGRVSDLCAGKSKNRGRARLLVLLAGYLIALTALCLLILTDTTQIVVFAAAAFLFSFGATWGLGVFYSILPEIYDSERVPLVTGAVGGIGDISMPAAPFVVGAVFGVRGLWRTGWSMCALVILLSVAAIVVLLRSDNGAAAVTDGF